MLGALRKHSRSVIIYVLFGVIIVVFVFTFNQAGMDTGCGGGKGGGATAKLAKVADTELDLSTLYMGLALSADPPSAGSLGDPKAFQQEMVYRSTRFARLRGDSRFGAYIPDPRTVPGIKARKVMDDLIETWLVSEEALANGLRASPEEIRERILKDFSDASGEFKKRSYDDWVRYGLRTSLARFEEFVRREVLREKMIAVVVSNVVVTDREARHVAAQRKAKRAYEYLEISPAVVAEAAGSAPAAVEGLVPTADEVASFLKTDAKAAQDWFDAHKDEFAPGPTYDFHWLKVQAPSRKVMASIGDAEQRKPLDDARAAARARAEDLAKGLKTPDGKAREGAALVKAFEEAARTADVATAADGGKVAAPMTEKEITAIDPALAAAVRGMTAGVATLAPLEGDDGFYLALLDGRVDGPAVTFDTAKEAVARKLLVAKKSDGVADRLAADALAKAQANPGAPLSETAVALNAPFGAAAPVRIGDTADLPGYPESLSGMLDWSPTAIPGIGESEELANAAAALTLEKPVAAKTFKVAGSPSIYVVRLKSATPAAEPTSDEVDAARQEFLPLKRQAWYREWYSQLRAQAAAKGRLVEHESLGTLIRDEAKAAEETQKRGREPAGKGRKSPLQAPMDDQ